MKTIAVKLKQKVRIHTKDKDFGLEMVDFIDLDLNTNTTHMDTKQYTHYKMSAVNTDLNIPKKKHVLC